MYIYRILVNRQLDNMDLVPYNIDAEYSMIEETNSSQQLITEITAQPYHLSLRLKKPFRTLTMHLKYNFCFSSKNICEKSCGARSLLTFGYCRICIVIKGTRKAECIFVLFNAKKCHKKATLVKIKIVIFSTVCATMQFVI